MIGMDNLGRQTNEMFAFRQAQQLRINQCLNEMQNILIMRMLQAYGGVENQ